LQALLLVSPEDCHVLSAPDPLPQEEELRLRVTHCALCRTDAKLWAQGHRDLALPRIPGHEICALNPEDGRRYVVWPGNACGQCDSCLRNVENLCSSMQIMGFHRDGGLAEWVCVRSENLLSLPKDLPANIAVLSEPLACGLNALQQLGAAPGESLIVYGAGAVGLLIALAAVDAGLNVRICDRQPEKLDKSAAFRKKLGIDGVLFEKLAGKADAAVNATSAPEAFRDAVRRLRSGGRLCFFSGISDQPSIPSQVLNDIHYRQLQVHGAYGCTRAQMRESLALLCRFSESVPALIEQQVSLEEVPTLFPDILQGKLLKSIVTF